MRTSSNCIPCFFRQANIVAAMLKLSRRKRREVFSFLTRKLLEFDFNRPSVVFGRTIYRALSRAAGIKDIFLREKIRSEGALLRNSAYVEKIIAAAKEPLRMAAKLSAAANAIDFGAGHTPDLKKIIREIKDTRLERDDFLLFKKKLAAAESILFIGDNCGETFFDKFFIREILGFNPSVRVFYAVRSRPTINDVLMSDARRIGLDRWARVFSSGCDYPGLILPKAGLRFKKIYRQADFIVSKGQGNFEALEDPRKDIFYLFKAKCLTVSEFVKVPLNSVLFLYNNR